jgi:excisionase family DNA binding protein
MMKSEILDAGGPHRLAYRVKHFCAAIGLGRTKFYELVRAGKIRTIIIGGRRLVPADEAQRLIREGCE